MKRLHFTAALLAGFCATPVPAQETRVGDRTIEKRSLAARMTAVVK